MSVPHIILVALGFLAVLAGLLLVLSNRRKNGIVLLLVYVAAYVPFSIAGRYVIGNHGGSDWRREWCPQYLVYEYRAMSGRTRTACNALGVVYWPCILLDRCLWHPGDKYNVACTSNVYNAKDASGPWNVRNGEAQSPVPRIMQRI